VTAPRPFGLGHALGPLLLACLPVAAAPAPAPAPEHASFVTTYQHPENPDFQVYYDELRHERFLESVAQELNRVLDLPATVTLRIAECGHSTTDWNPAGHVVTLCYEFLDAVLVLAGDGEGATTPEHAEQLFSGAVTFALFGEVGRALVSLYGLPTPQGAERAGDEFAAITLAAAEQDGDPSAAAALEFFDGALKQPDSGFEYLETHGFNRARLETVACILYGNAPTNHSQAVARGILSAERVPRCAEEVVAAAKAWDLYLKDHSKPLPAPAPAAAAPAAPAAPAPHP
jgi:hypothetical protein